MTPEDTLDTLRVGDRAYRFYSLAAAERLGLPGVSRLPYTLKIVLENLLRQRAQARGQEGDVAALMSWLDAAAANLHVQFFPTRVMMDDTAGLPLLGDLAAMRDAAKRLGRDASCIDPVIPIDFVVDHSVIADHTGSADALNRNMSLEMKRNAERYRFLRWAEQGFRKLRVVPPGAGICHQINLEYLAQVVSTREQTGGEIAYPDTMVGIDSHTPMSNSLGLVAWGVSGIEGLSAALGEPVALAIPKVVGCRLTGELQPGVTATDLVLTLTGTLRAHHVVGKFIEYWGPGLAKLTLQDRATLANMTPEAGATMSYFPIDGETLRYLKATGREPGHVALVEAYAKAQGLWCDDDTAALQYSEVIVIDLGAIAPSVSGPRLPHQRVPLNEAPAAFQSTHVTASDVVGANASVRNGDVVIAAITSCTNTSNPALMIGAGLLARNAVRRGLKVPPWVKTSLSPGSRVVADYLKGSGLQESLDALGFHVAGFGCMTCVGFSGPLDAAITSALEDNGINAVAVLSGNRNYEGRAHPLIRSSFLASPSLVVAYALTGTILRDLTTEAVGEDSAGRPVYLREIWPDAREIQGVIDSSLDSTLFSRSYSDVFSGTAEWRAIEAQSGADFAWDAESTFIRRPPLFDDVPLNAEPPADIRGARILAMYGDMVTTEHVSPMGPIPDGSPAAQYLESLGIAARDFVSYAVRRINHDVMMRGTLASPHLRNELTPGAPGGFTRHWPDGTRMTIFDAAQRYLLEGVPLVVIAGQAFGAGSSRDWSAKGPHALGVRAVIAESFERIYRSNLVAAGVLPLELPAGETRGSLGLDGAEAIDIVGLAGPLAPRMQLGVSFTRASGETISTRVTARLDTAAEVEHFRQGGLLRGLLRRRVTESGEVSPVPRGLLQARAAS